MRPSALILLVLGALVACRATSANDPGPAPEPAPALAATLAAWSPEFDAPRLLETDRVRLEPLAPEHTELDFAAVMGSREHLQRTLRWGDWPTADFTVEGNRGDLERHWGEFERHEAYAYTVLAPDRSRCLGCIYINPPPSETGEPDPRGAMIAFWVVEESLATDLDRHLLSALVTWLEQRFPLDNVAFFPHVDDARGAQILGDVGLTEAPSPSGDHRLFVWRRAEGS